MIAESLAAACPQRIMSLVLGGFPVGLDAAQRAAMEEPAEELPGSIDEMFADWPPELAEVFIAHNDFGAILAVQQTLYLFPTTIAELQAAPHPTVAYYGADDIYLDLARQQAAALGCQFRTVPGDHIMAFTRAANILPAAVAHFEAAKTQLAVTDSPLA
jgi:hypothetical protein